MYSASALLEFLSANALREGNMYAAAYFGNLYRLAATAEREAIDRLTTA